MGNNGGILRVLLSAEWASSSPFLTESSLSSSAAFEANMTAFWKNSIMCSSKTDKESVCLTSYKAEVLALNMGGESIMDGRKQTEECNVLILWEAKHPYNFLFCNARLSHTARSRWSRLSEWKAAVPCCTGSRGCHRAGLMSVWNLELAQHTCSFGGNKGSVKDVLWASCPDFSRLPAALRNHFDVISTQSRVSGSTVPATCESVFWFRRHKILHKTCFRVYGRHMLLVAWR